MHWSVGMKHKFSITLFEFTYCGFWLVFPMLLRIFEGLVNFKVEDKVLEEAFLNIIVIVCLKWR